MLWELIIYMYSKFMTYRYIYRDGRWSVAAFDWWLWLLQVVQQKDS